jgi:signal peptidase I
VAAIFVGVARGLAIRWWQVPLGDPELSASIAPSLGGGDWVLLWRLTRPGLGDLVMCPDPDDPTNVVIGRIAAEAHQTIVINGDDLTVDDKHFNIEYNCTEQAFSVTNPDSLKQEDLYCDMEDVGEKLHMRGYGGSKLRSTRKYKKTVGSGEVFLLSDNRAFPFDSRHYGVIERRTCTETIFFRLVSAQGFLDVKTRLTTVR